MKLKPVTGTEGGLTGEEQIQLALTEIVRNGGTASTQSIYAAIEAILNPRGLTLSEQGKASLRFFINKVAVAAGFVYPHDKTNPGWRITERGREVALRGATTETAIDVDSGLVQEIPSNTARGEAFELYVLRVLKAAYPYYAWHHQGRDKRNERGVDFVGKRIGDSRGEPATLAAQVKFHKPNIAPTEREWLKFLSGCFARRIDVALFVTTGRLTSEQRREAQEAGVVVLEGKDEITRLAALHHIGPFDLFEEIAGSADAGLDAASAQ
ncbi:MAG: restriction endonuclease [Polyangiaceae bacterium]|nr:restriction endonuclease [Polyangiaceae bacterium]